jgi:tRNA threonylcarbamoyladenosine biosynthesis protein TsaE
VEEPIRDLLTHSPEETIAFGRELAAHLAPPCLVLLEGELGAGKTTLVKGIAAGLGVAREEDVTSPTFTLVHEYGSGGTFYHVDLYRIEDPREISTLGLDDALASQSTVIVEWGERLGDNSPPAQFRIQMECLENETRRIRVYRLHP